MDCKCCVSAALRVFFCLLKGGLVLCISAEPEAGSKGFRGHDHVHDGPGASGVPALEEGARTD